jgi:hypothetical protein
MQNMSNKNNFTPKAFLNCLDFQPFNLSTFQKRVVRTKFEYLVLSVPDEGYSRNEPCALSLISAFLSSLDKTSSGGGSLTD